MSQFSKPISSKSRITFNLYASFHAFLHSKTLTSYGNYIFYLCSFYCLCWEQRVYV